MSSWNSSYRVTVFTDKAGNKRRHMSKAAGVEGYQLVAASIARRAKPAVFDPPGMVYVRYWLYLKHDMDATNALKCLEDAIAAGLDVNDRIFLPAVLYKEHGNPDPHVVVEVEWD